MRLPADRQIRQPFECSPRPQSLGREPASAKLRRCCDRQMGIARSETAALAMDALPIAVAILHKGSRPGRVGSFVPACLNSHAVAQSTARYDDLAFRQACLCCFPVCIGSDPTYGLLKKPGMRIKEEPVLRGCSRDAPSRALRSRRRQRRRPRPMRPHGYRDHHRTNADRASLATNRPWPVSPSGV